MEVPINSCLLLTIHKCNGLHDPCLGASGRTGAYFGSGSGPIHLDYVVCSGTEYNVTDCQIQNETRQSSHSEDVGVKCQTSKGGMYTMKCQLSELSLSNMSVNYTALCGFDIGRTS